MVSETVNQSWSSDDTSPVTYNGPLGPTKSYGGGSLANPILTKTKGWNATEMTTDFRAAYDPATSRFTNTAPRSSGWSLNFDGTPAGQGGGNWGYTQSDIVQIYNNGAWFNGGNQRMFGSYQRTFSSNRTRGGTFDTPIAWGDGSQMRSYSYTDYSTSWNSSNGKIVEANIPVVHSWNWSFDGLKSYNHGNTTQVNDPFFWAKLGRMVLVSTRSRSFSSDAPPSGVEADGAAFQDGGTQIYGGGTFDAPIFAFDSSQQRTDIQTTYTNSFKKNFGEMGHYTENAPTGAGWSWSDSGVGEGHTVGFSKTDLQQTNRNDLWSTLGAVRLQESTAKSYSSNGALVGGTPGVDSVYGAGSFVSPFVQDNDTWFHGFNRTTYVDSWGTDSQPGPGRQAPKSSGWTVSFDGFHFQKSVSNTTNNNAVWNWVGKASSCSPRRRSRSPPTTRSSARTSTIRNTAAEPSTRRSSRAITRSTAATTPWTRRLPITSGASRTTRRPSSTPTAGTAKPFQFREWAETRPT